MKNTLLASLLWAGCFLIFTVGAETIEPLETLVVSATRSERDAIATSSSIKIITRDDIEQGGATHIVEVLRNQGGIQVADLFGDGSRAMISLRGFGGNAQANTLILVDGRRLNNSDLGGPDLNSVSLKDIERIEIVRGSAGVLFGDQAVGGVINIITRRPEAFHADAALVYGSYDRRSATLDLSGRHAGGVGYRLTGEKRKSDNYRDNNELDYTNLSGLADFEYPSGRVFVELQDINESLETPGALFIDQLKADRRQAFNPDDFVNTDTRNIRLGFLHNVRPDWDLQGEYTYRSAESDGLLSVGGVGGPFLTKRDHREFTPRLTGAVATAYGPALITVGADVYLTEFFLSSVLGVIDNDQSQYAVYGQGVFPLTARWSLTVGARYAFVNNDIFGALLPPGTEIDDDVGAYEAGLSFRITPDWRLFARIDSNYRFVLADEYTSASFGGVIPDTQTGRSLELGMDWSSERAAIQLAAYRLDLEDEIDFDPLLFINTNIGDTERNGFIIDVAYAPVAGLDLGMNYGFVDAEIESGPLEGLPIPFVARHTARITAGYRLSERWRGQLEILGIGERTATGDFFNANPPLPGYVIGNLVIDYQRGPLSAGLRINNLLDKEYRDSAQIGFRPPLFRPETAYFPAPERNFLITLAYEFH